MEIKVFGMENCPGCVTVKKMLSERGVEFAERDVMNIDHMEEAQALGIRGVPTVVLSGDNYQMVFVGSEKKTLDEIRAAVGVS